MLLVCSPAFGGVIVNGGFENGTTSGWTLTGLNPDNTVVAGDMGPVWAYYCGVNDLSWPAYAGNYSLYPGPVEPGYLSQDVPTEPGQTWDVTFALSMFALTPDAEANELSLTPNAFQAKWGDAVLMGWGNPADPNDPGLTQGFGWTTYTFSGLTPSAGDHTTLSFEFYAPGYSFALDSVDAVDSPAPVYVPEPASLLLLGTGLIALGGSIRRRLVG